MSGHGIHIRVLCVTVSIWLAVVLVVVSLVSCSKEEPTPLKKGNAWEELPAIANVEIARTQDERRTGLMARTHLKKNSGMFFIMDREETQSFWMRNTRIPLSIAYINSENVIVDIKDMQPYDERGVRSSRPAKYALEMEKGWFEENGIVPGCKAIPDDLDPKTKETKMRFLNPIFSIKE